MQRLFQRQGPTQRSQGSSNFSSSNHSFDQNDPRVHGDDERYGDALNRCRSTDVDNPQHSLLRVSKAGLAIPFTEIPAPSQLRDSGYVEMAFTHIPDGAQSLEQQQQQQQQSSSSSEQRPTVLSRSPRLRGLLLSRRATNSQEGLEHLSWSPSDMPSAKFSSTESATSNISSDSSNSPSFQSGVGSNLSLLPATSPIGIGTYRSYSLSPVETQPLTMPEIEVNEHFIPAPKTYFGLALFSTLCCFLPAGVLALLSSQQVRKHLAERDRYRASLSSKKAKCRSLWAIALGVAQWTTVVVVLTVLLVLKVHISGIA